MNYDTDRETRNPHLNTEQGAAIIQFREWNVSDGQFNTSDIEKAYAPLANDWDNESKCWRPITMADALKLELELHESMTRRLYYPHLPGRRTVHKIDVTDQEACRKLLIQLVSERLTPHEQWHGIPQFGLP